MFRKFCAILAALKSPPPNLEGLGKITGKEFVPGYLMYQEFDPTTPSPFLPTRFPDTWWIEVEVAGMRDDLIVSQPCYESLMISDEVMVEYAIGIFSGRVHIRGIHKPLPRTANPPTTPFSRRQLS